MIFVKFHDPGPEKKFKKFEILEKNFFTQNNQEGLNLRSEHHFG